MPKRNVNGHLVTVEVSVEGSTYKRMQLDCFSFNQLWLECLDTKSVQGRSTVEQNRMSFQHVFQNIPNDRVFTVNNLLSALHGLNNTTLNHLTNNERFEKLCSHVLRKTAFVEFHIRSNDNY